MTLIALRRMLAPLCIILACSPGAARSQSGTQDYPSRPITVLIPFAPGATDLMARIYTTELTRTLGWTFTYDYKPGAAGRVGTALAARAAPDGYSMHGNSSTISIGEYMPTRLPYDWRKDFIPLFQMNRTPGILLVTPGLPVRTVGEYIAWAKANPGRLNYATNGAGGIVHIVAEFMHSQMGVKVTYVPYKGFGPSSSALIAGEVQATHASYLAHKGNILAGKVRPIALTSAKGRLPQLPELKTIAEEAGLPEFEHIIWLGLFLPSGVPAPIVNRLSGELNKATRSPEVLKKLDEMGEQPGGGSPEEFRRFLEGLGAKLGRVIKANNIVLEE